MSRPATPPYRVRLVPFPMVIDADGNPVAQSHVVEIIFPGDAIDTAIGKVNTIVGTGAAKIIVGDITFRGVPLVECHPTSNPESSLRTEVSPAAALYQVDCFDP